MLIYKFYKIVIKLREIVNLIRIYRYNFMKFPILLSPSLSHQLYFWYYLSSNHSYKLPLTATPKSIKKIIWLKKILYKKPNILFTPKFTPFTPPFWLLGYYQIPKLPFWSLFFKFSSNYFFKKLALWIYNNILLIAIPNQVLTSEKPYLVNKFANLYYPQNFKQQLKLL